MEDRIVKEVREVREAYAARFNYDLDAIFADLKRNEQETGREVVKAPPNPEEPKTNKNR